MRYEYDEVLTLLLANKMLIFPFQTSIFQERIPSYSNVSVFGVHTGNRVDSIRTVFESMRICLRRTAPYSKRISVNERPKLIDFAPSSFQLRGSVNGA